MQATLATFTQQAEGTFAVYLRPNTPHCGPRTRAIAVRETFEYRIVLTFGKDALDEHGFLIDNTWFSQYFASFDGVQIGISCEKLTCLIADDLARHCGARLCQCRALEVAIKPVAGVWVSCAYDVTGVSA